MPSCSQSIDKVDDYTVKFTLKEPQAPFLADLAMDFASIQSKEYADALLKAGKPELIDQEPIGTGPFELRAATRRTPPSATGPSRATGGRSRRSTTLVFAITKDPAVRLAKLRANECQVMPYPNPADLPAIRSRQEPADARAARPEHRLPRVQQRRRSRSPTSACARPSTWRSTRRRSSTAVYQGAGKPAKNLIPPTMWCYNKSIQDYPYDPGGGEEAAGRGRLPERLRDRPVGDAGAAPVQPRRASASPS